MASLGVGECLNGKRKKKAMWRYPKVLGFNPPERWGHSACCFDGVLYVFGGCCGGLHFSDVLKLDLETMTWSTLATTGQKPGTRDSHSTVLVGQKMVVFGGTNGSKKVNDIHMLDLKIKEWSMPRCFGIPPSPRESHTVTVVGEDRLVVFGGSGEGGGNYLNDVHILDLKTMAWNSPIIKGDLPAPRDSHTSVVIGNHKILVYGGDCGDRYYGEVDILDVDTLTWSRLDVRGSTPGVRAGHSAISIGTKVYIIGGVGDKHYYSDVWILDINTCSWTQLEVSDPRPQGRFSHTAVVANADVIVYGGCGEDERPLNELLVLQLNGHDGRNDVSMCKVFSNNWGQYKHKFINNSKISRRNEAADQIGHEFLEESKKKPYLWELDGKSVKRRWSPEVVESEQEEHSLSLSHNSSASQSDQEQTNFKKTTTTIHHQRSSSSILQTQRFGQFKLLHRDPSSNCKRSSIHIETTGTDFDSIQRESSSRPPLKTEQFLRDMHHPGKPESGPLLAVDRKPNPQNRPPPPPTLPPVAPPPHMGSEVHGMVDGAFDSGYLITANVNGQIFRGVLFAPAPAVSVIRSVIPARVAHSQPPPPPQAMVIPVGPLNHVRPLPPYAPHESSSGQCHTILPAKPAPIGESHKAKGDLQGVVLTLGGPGGGD